MTKLLITSGRRKRDHKQEELVGIRTVFQHEKEYKSKLDIELELDSEDDSKEFDFFIPPTNKDNWSTSFAASPLIAVMEEKTTSPINLPTLK